MTFRITEHHTLLTTLCTKLKLIKKWPLSKLMLDIAHNINLLLR
jgi:hypothetical protein